MSSEFIPRDQYAAALEAEIMAVVSRDERIAREAEARTVR